MGILVGMYVSMYFSVFLRFTLEDRELSSLQFMPSTGGHMGTYTGYRGLIGLRVEGLSGMRIGHESEKSCESGERQVLTSEVRKRQLTEGSQGQTYV